MSATANKKKKDLSLLFRESERLLQREKGAIFRRCKEKGKASFPPGEGKKETPFAPQTKKKGVCPVGRPGIEKKRKKGIQN